MCSNKKINNTLQLYNLPDQPVIIYVRVCIAIKFLFRDLRCVFVGEIYFIKEVMDHPSFQPSLWIIIFHNLLPVMIIFPIISSSLPRNTNIWTLFKHDSIQKAIKFIQKYHNIPLVVFLIGSLINSCWKLRYIHTLPMLQKFLGEWKSAIWMCMSSSYVM